MFERAFHEIASANGLPVAGDPTSMFGDTGFRDADLLVGASIKRFSVDACAPLSASKVKGSSHLEIEWQVFSKREGRLIYRGSTTAEYRLEKPTDGGVFKLVLEPFKECVRQLALSRELQGAVLSAR
ncbi:MAG: hypothetical protein IE933_13570 [Sphingomonadales bacterium]|nr:hypothetical protein [Sphingomonadales bacterium]MBD3774978.1 hypothetical protein [Paracoccaceae bacterium]